MKKSFLSILFTIALSGTCLASDKIVELVYEHFPKEEYSVELTKIIKADFDNNGLEDYALIIRNYHYKHEKAVALMQGNKNQFKPYVLESRDDYHNDIRKISAKTHIAPYAKDTAPFQLANSAIEVSKKGRSTQLHFWSESKFDSVVINLKHPDFDVDNELKSLVEDHYPGSEIKNPFEFQLALNETLGKEILTPTVVKADLDGNELIDYAVILNQGVFTIFRQTQQNVFEKHTILESDYPGDYIAEIKPNKLIKQTEAIDTHHDPVQLDYSSVELYYYGKSSVVYFWDKEANKFKQIWTSD